MKILLSWGAWLAQSIEHVTQSLGYEFKPHTWHGAYLRKKEKKKILNIIKIYEVKTKETTKRIETSCLL